MSIKVTREIELELNPKQDIAWDYLEDNETEEILYGGAAGGGKSYLGCAYVISQCLKYSGVRYFFGRKELKRLRTTTLVTFFKVCKHWGLKEKVHYKINWQIGVIKWRNGSEILLLDLDFKPSDPDYERFGSLELTGGFIDEAGEIRSKCRDVLRRAFRYMLKEYSLPVKILMSCNPSENFLYHEYYVPNKKGTLEPYKKFVKAFVKDNADFLPDDYEEKTLGRIKDKKTKARLKAGDWEFDDGTKKLFKLMDISDMFTNPLRPNPEDKYLSADVSEMGVDKTIVGIWHGLALVKIIEIPSMKTNKTAKEIKRIGKDYGIRRSRMIIDKDGLGAGVVNNIRGCVAFVNASSPIKPEDRKEDEEDKKKKEDDYYGEDEEVVNFANLRAQCYYELSFLVEDGDILIDTKDTPVIEYITEELRQIERKNDDNEKKLAIIPKKEIKENLGRSPDYADMIMMRIYFELARELEPNIRVITSNQEQKKDTVKGHGDYDPEDDMEDDDYDIEDEDEEIEYDEDGDEMTEWDIDMDDGMD